MLKNILMKGTYYNNTFVLIFLLKIDSTIFITYTFRLTLELSCAMKFEAYPHDTQNCSMMIESCKYILTDYITLNKLFFKYIFNKIYKVYK